MGNRNEALRSFGNDFRALASRAKPGWEGRERCSKKDTLVLCWLSPDHTYLPSQPEFLVAAREKDTVPLIKQMSVA